jgi:hypothetical protein
MIHGTRLAPRAMPNMDIRLPLQASVSARVRWRRCKRRCHGPAVAGTNTARPDGDG